jgi:hypothetical protein
MSRKCRVFAAKWREIFGQLTAGCVEVSTSSWNGNGYYDCFGRRGHKAQAFLPGATGRKPPLPQLPSSGANEGEGAE